MKRNSSMWSFSMLLIGTVIVTIVCYGFGFALVGLFIEQQGFDSATSDMVRLGSDGVALMNIYYCIPFIVGGTILLVVYIYGLTYLRTRDKYNLIILSFLWIASGFFPLMPVFITSCHSHTKHKSLQDTI